MIQLKDFSTISPKVEKSFRSSRAFSAAGRAILDKHEESERKLNSVSRNALSIVNKSLNSIEGCRED